MELNQNRLTAQFNQIRSCALCFIVFLGSFLAVSASTNLTVTLSSSAWTNHHFEVSLTGPSGYDYIVQVSENLTSWRPLSTNSPNSLPWRWVDANAPAEGSRFYRVLASLRPAPMITNISPSIALTLIQDHRLESDFVILDVRTSAEYSARHILGARNLDFYSSTFKSDLSLLDKSKTYLVYCASGSRSRQAVELMRQAEFLRVYNMLNGFGSLAALPGAAALLEP